MESNYQPTQGSYEVRVASNLVLTTATNRQMPLDIYYPEESGEYPVIIFSHGAGASKDSFEALGSYWASHGYISIHPTHADSLSLEENESLRQILTTMLNEPNRWVERVGEISLIIDSLDELATEAPGLQGKIDRQRIGVGGHSYGAYTSQVIGGATIDLPNRGTSQSLADSRVKSILLLSPQGVGQQGLTRTSWNRIQRPMMVMTGSKDQGAQGQGPEWKREPFDYSPAGEKYLVFIENANHFSFSGRKNVGNFQGFRNRQFGNRRRRLGNGDGRLGDGRLRARINQRNNERQGYIFDYVKIASLAFWDSSLKDEQSSEAYLNSDDLQQYSEGDVTILTK